VRDTAVTASLSQQGNDRQELHMTGSNKAYSAPHLDALSLRSTRDIIIDIGAAVHIDIGFGLLS